MTQTESESARTVERSAESKRGAGKAFAFLTAIILVNVIGLSGQAAGMYGQLVGGPLSDWPAFLSATAATLVGVAMESIGIYLMLQAHDATMESQASGSLRLGAYAIAGIMAALNYDHWSRWAVALGVTFALFSMVSPYLWSVRAKRAHAAQLAARGQVDPAGVKLSSNRKFYHPILSLRVARWASWAGQTDPALAVSGWEAARSGQSVPLRAEIEIETPETKSPAVLQIETAETESDTETVTETVTETKTVERKRSVSRAQKREQIWRERLKRIESAHSDWREREITYNEIKSALGLSGVETVKGIYAALARERERVQISG